MTPSRIASIAVAVGLLLAVAAACGSDAEPTAVPTAPTAAPADTAAPAQPTTAAAQPTATAPAQADGEVAADIANFTLVDLTVPVGTTVRWTNRDSAIHTTTSGEPGSETGTWDSGRLNSGQSFSFTYNEAGTFVYFCQIHPSTMRATVTVTGAGAAAAPTAVPSPAAQAAATPTAAPPPPPPPAQPAATATTAPAQPTAAATPTAAPTASASAPPPPPPPPAQPAATATTAPAQPTATATPAATPPAPTATAEPTATAIPTATTEAAPSVEIAASRDNTLYEDATGSISNGCGEFIYVGRTNGESLRRGMLQFDVASSLPQGATVISASLKLRVTKTRAESQTITVHRVLVGWGEGSSVAPLKSGDGGGGGGTDATTGDATWVHTFFDTATWASPGGDFASEASAEKAVAAPASYRWTSDQMVTDVQGWLDDPASNYGWILVGNEAANRTTKKFASRENGNEDHHPLLTVEFTGGGAAPAAAAAPACGGGAGPSAGSGSGSGSGIYD